mmetsp:Transcript_25901/g.55110  ORF Transcript_25901/g.55110 Transcript_25901/m.55110 type:complete len:461 (-) Transcript_25901:228-1610(-)
MEIGRGRIPAVLRLHDNLDGRGDHLCSECGRRCSGSAGLFLGVAYVGGNVEASHVGRAPVARGALGIGQAVRSGVVVAAPANLEVGRRGRGHGIGTSLWRNVETVLTDGTTISQIARWAGTAKAQRKRVRRSADLQIAIGGNDGRGGSDVGFRGSGVGAVTHALRDVEARHVGGTAVARGTFRIRITVGLGVRVAAAADREAGRGGRGGSLGTGSGRDVVAVQTDGTTVARRTGHAAAAAIPVQRVGVGASALAAARVVGRRRDADALGPLVVAPDDVGEAVVRGVGAFRALSARARLAHLRGVAGGYAAVKLLRIGIPIHPHDHHASVKLRTFGRVHVLPNLAQPGPRVVQLVRPAGLDAPSGGLAPGDDAGVAVDVSPTVGSGTVAGDPSRAEAGEVDGRADGAGRRRGGDEGAEEEGAGRRGGGLLHFSRFLNPRVSDRTGIDVLPLSLLLILARRR